MNGHRGMASVGIPVGETVEQALRRLEPAAPSRELPSGAAEARWVARLARLLSEPINLEALFLAPQGTPEADGSTPSVWVQRDNPQTVDQVLGQMQYPPPPVVEPNAVPVVVPAMNTWPVPVPTFRYEEPPRPTPVAADDAFTERLLKAWRYIAGALAALAILMILTALRALLPKSAPPEPAPVAAIAMPTDSAYLAEIGQELEGRCITWGAELRDAEELLAGAGMEPVRLTLRADEVFAGTRGRPRLLAEGRLQDSESPSPLRAQAVGGVTVRRYHDRPLDAARGGGILRSIEATW